MLYLLIRSYEDGLTPGRKDGRIEEHVSCEKIWLVPLSRYVCIMVNLDACFLALGLISLCTLHSNFTSCCHYLSQYFWHVTVLLPLLFWKESLIITTI